MFLGRVLGQLFDVLVDHANGRRGRLCNLAVLAVTGILTALVPLAYASPPDPTWIAGIYDNADYDEVVGLVTDGTGASSSPVPARVEQCPVGSVLLPEWGPAPCWSLGAQMSRGPPVGTRDTVCQSPGEPRHCVERYPPRGLLVADHRPDLGRRSSRNRVVSSPQSYYPKALREGRRCP